MGVAYAYEAVDRRGRRVRSLEESLGPDVLRAELERRGLVVLEIAPASDRAPSSRASAPRPGGADLLDFTRALAGLLGAGLPLAKGLASAGSMLRPRMAAVAHRIQVRVEQGASLATVLAEQGPPFSGLYVGLVRAGERGGDLAGAFHRLAEHLEREAEIRSKLVSASVYPLLLAIGGGAAVLVLLVVVLPRFADMLAASGARLPASTALLLSFAQFLQRYWVVMLLLALTGIGLVLWSRESGDGRRIAAQLLNALPGAGGLRRELLGARVPRLLAVLLGGGAPVLAALEGAAEAIDDPLTRDSLEGIRARVREGAALHRAMTETGVFPAVLTQLAALGEDTGRLAEFLGKAAQILEDRVERSVQRLVALAEPAMIIVFGGIVGFVALSLLQAIYSVNASSFR